jgi:hypothetical protein
MPDGLAHVETSVTILAKKSEYSGYMTLFPEAPRLAAAPKLQQIRGFLMEPKRLAAQNRVTSLFPHLRRRRAPFQTPEVLYLECGVSSICEALEKRPAV